MANYQKGRTHTRSQFGNMYGGYSYGPGSSWNRGNSSNKSHTKKNNARGNAGAGTTAYKTVCNNIERKLDSFKTLFQQAQGTGGAHRPTPSTLTSFCNWVNKGAVIQTCSTAQVNRWAQTTNKSFNPSNPSPNACKKVLAAKFGRGCIKAVAKTKTGQFMVATTPTVNGRTFCFPH
ncbi:MAG: hypothetical protein HY287_04930 [Planctomycetes bacterium]|nr:hypothetical protein [Planctomycetota bacterium]MBI3833658.1 hypothetical protein [Planctomycetota bacterium]